MINIKNPVPTALQPWLFDFRRVRLLSLLCVETYLLSGGPFGVFWGERKWHWDEFMSLFIYFFWKENFRWLMPGALVIAGIVFLALDLRGPSTRLGLWVGKRTGFVSLRSPVFTWARWTMGFIVGVTALVFLPAVTSATHSWMFTILLIPVAATPLLVGWCLCSIQVSPGPAELPLIPCRSKLVAYDVRVKDGCLPYAVTQIQQEYVEEDRLHGTDGEIWKWLRPRMEVLYRDLVDFFGKVVDRDRIVFTESAWDAFGRILDQHASSLDKVLTTTIEPYEITSRMMHSAVAGKVLVLDMSDEPIPHSSPEDAIIDSVAEAVRSTEPTNSAQRDWKSFMLILSQVDCRRGNILNLNKIFRACAAISSQQKVTFIYVVNGQLGLGNIALKKELVDQCHYLVTDGNHWLRGADDLGIIIFGGQDARVPPEGSHGTKLLSFEDWKRVEPEMLASFGFAVAKHTQQEARPQNVMATGRRRSMEMLAFGKCLDLLMIEGKEIIAKSAQTEAVQDIVAAHSKKLAEAFALKFNERLYDSRLALCVDPPENGMVVLYRKGNAGSGGASIEELRKMLAKDRGIQCKMLGSNNLNRPAPEMDRLRFCFQYFHGSDDVELVLNAILWCRP